jgi:DNA-binding beta-propeller fold protein YncE
MVTDHFQGVVYQYLVNRGNLRLVREFQFDAGVSGVAWGANRFFVGNTTDASVGVYRPGGTWMYDLGGPGTFGYPTDIEVDEGEDLVFVLDNRRQSILLFTINGDLRDTWRARDLEMENPVAMGIDPVRQELLVSDYGAMGRGGGPFAIHVFDYEGNRLKMISGKLGMLGARFSRPQGITVDGQGRILVVDALSSELLVMDRDTGTILDRYGEQGTGPGQMLAPLDVAVDADGRAFVTNNRLGRIEVFEVGGGF